MNSKRLYFIMLGIIALLTIGLIGGAYEANAVLKQQSQHLMNDKLQAQVVADEQAQLAKAKEDIQKYQDLSTVAQSIVPQDKDQAQTVREIVDIANANGIVLGSITFPASTLGAKTGGSTSDQQLSQLSPVQGISGVYNLQLTVASDVTHSVPYANFVNFLTSLEHNRRTALVNSITITPDTKNRNLLSFTLILDEYIKP